MTYDELLNTADNLGLLVKEKPLKSYKGRIKGNKVAIRKDIPTSKEKACVLAEEIGHHLTSYGNILDQSKVENRKQEHKARAVAYDIQIGLDGIIKIYEAGCTSIHMAAEFLGVTEDFFRKAIRYYESKYGLCVTKDNYIIYFNPSLSVMKMIR